MAGLTTQAVVIGAGPTGLTAALALCACGVEVALTAPPYDRALVEADRRTTALLPGSIELLKNLGVWEACERHAAPLEGVRLVDDRGGLLRAPEVLFKAQEVGRTSFGVNTLEQSAMRRGGTGAYERMKRSGIRICVGLYVGSARR